MLCDESQFFTPEQADQLFLVTVDLGIPVICYGLRADFMMRGFPARRGFWKLRTIEELKTICACGRKAICNGRKVNGEFVFEGAQSPSTQWTMWSTKACAPMLVPRVPRISGTASQK